MEFDVAAFTFKLEAVLEQRKLAERLRQRDVAMAQRGLLKVQAELDAVAAVKRSSAAELRGGAGRGGGQKLGAAMLAAHQRFALAAREKAAGLGRQMTEARRELDHAQARLIEAAKQRKVMEKLREREHAKWVEAQRKKDRLESEEAARRAHDDGAGARAAATPTVGIAASLRG
jgi:flagellar FliJ protein